MFGREYRKFASRLLALIAFKWIAIWLLIAASVRHGRAGEAVALGIIALDICTTCVLRTSVAISANRSRKDWADRLTNRIFYQLFWAQVTAGNAHDLLPVDAPVFG